MKWEYLISGIVGLVTGTVGSLVAPWVHWWIEKKKENRYDKVDLIKQLRIYLENNEPREDNFINSHNYIRIRPHLSDSLINDLEDSQTLVVQSTPRSYYKSRFLEELEHIEELWGIGLRSKRKSKRDFKMKSGQPRIIVRKGNLQKERKES